MSPLRVVMLEDSALDAELIQSELETGGMPCEVHRVERRDEFVAALGISSVDLILADFSLPDFDGITAMQLARETRPEIPFIFVSGALGEELAIETMKSGATDYVLKQRLDRLCPSVRRALRETRERTERRRAEDALRFLASASAHLNESLDHEETLARVAHVAVPFLADWSAVFLINGDGGLRCAASHHRSGAQAELLATLRRGGKLSLLPPGKAAEESVKRRATMVYPAEEARRIALPEDRELLGRLGLQNMLVAPLWARGRILGALTLVASESTRIYDFHDLRLGEDLSRRAALAIDAARLYQEAQTADRRKDEFLAMLAHELRNPLAPIVNAVELMRPHCAGIPEMQRIRSVVERQARHMTRLVDDLLDVSRITRGKIALRRQRMSLRGAVENAVQTSRPLVETRRHTLTVAFDLADHEDCWLDADPARLEQILCNLLNNAAKYTEPGGAIQLAVATHGSEVEIRVRDSGIGIPAAMLSHVFELFVQVSPTIDRTQGGLGLGLTLVRNLVELHGGRVEARSGGEGQGSEFIVHMPLASPPEAILSGPSSKDSRISASGQDAPPLRILVVDDSIDARESLEDLLRMWGHQVVSAADGFSAVELCEKQVFDVALVDVGLPRMSGYEVARNVRHLEDARAWRRLFLVALTGYGQPEDRRRAFEAGFDEHRTKPLESLELRALLRQVQSLAAPATAMA